MDYTEIFFSPPACRERARGLCRREWRKRRAQRDDGVPRERCFALKETPPDLTIRVRAEVLRMPHADKRCRA